MGNGAKDAGQTKGDEPCGSGWTGDRCTKRLGHAGCCLSHDAALAENALLDMFSPRHEVVCAWCQATMTRGVLPASHGICLKCRDFYFGLDDLATELGAGGAK